jgi:hypothetical protein
MKFKSKPEAYLYILHILCEIRGKVESTNVKAILDEAIGKIQIEVENHQQDIEIISNILLSVSSNLSNDNHKQNLSELICAVQQSNFEQTLQNELGRRLESQIQIELLLNPTDLMMASVLKMSKKIVEIIDEDEFLQEDFLDKLIEKGNITFGSYQKLPSYQDPKAEIRVKDVLQKNRKQDLIKIMHMHYKFSEFFARSLVGKYEEFSKKMFEISDEKFYHSKYFEDRGRNGNIKYIKTQKMGISISDKDLYSASLPKDPSKWVADAKAQAAKPKDESFFVEKLVNSDTPYVSGPSGMTSLLIGQIIAFEVHASKTEQQCYLAAVTAYIVSGGFHSLHEVLGPVALCLPEPKLVPGYQVSLPGSSELPNYHVFYSEMERIDPQFIEVRKEAWRKLLAFFKDEYLPCADVEIAKFVTNNKGVISFFKQAYDKCPDNPSSWMEAAMEIFYKDEKTELHFKRDRCEVLLDKLMSQGFENALIKHLQFQEILDLENMLDKGDASQIDLSSQIKC